MIIRAAIVPQPPLLLPELVGGARIRTEPVRAACVTAARELADVADNWVAIAADPAGPESLEPDTRGTFAGYGADVRVSLAANLGDLPADPSLPLPALVAGWLRAQVGAARVRVRLFAPDLPAADCRRAGAELAAELAGPAPVGLLVLGDGANRHGDRSPGARDDRSGPFDDEAGAALATADPDALLALDTGLATELNAAGRVAWQVLAGVALTVGGRWTADALYSDHPFGVAYHVAVWNPGLT